mmetsp:Transcript_13541/g.51685  ORF Transcript_13541/g.51685 Transcript_13541/m.51685 type:complete len:213 (-) Transcript_13541:334-972(-)
MDTSRNSSRRVDWSSTASRVARWSAARRPWARMPLTVPRAKCRRRSDATRLDSSSPRPEAPFRSASAPVWEVKSRSSWRTLRRPEIRLSCLNAVPRVAANSPASSSSSGSSPSGSCAADARAASRSRSASAMASAAASSRAASQSSAEYTLRSGAGRVRHAFCAATLAEPPECSSSCRCMAIARSWSSVLEPVPAGTLDPGTSAGQCPVSAS